MRRRELLAGALPWPLLAQGSAALQPAAMRDVQGVLDSLFPIFWNAKKR